VLEFFELGELFLGFLCIFMGRLTLQYVEFLLLLNVSTWYLSNHHPCVPLWGVPLP